MGNYKSEIYKKYSSIHADRIYGVASLEKFRNNFSSWDHIYANVLPESKDANILDMGCGSGGFVYYLKNKKYTKVAGIDISDEQIDRGRSLGIGNIEKYDLLSYLSENKDTYDLIIARDVLEHFDKSEIYNVCMLVFSALKHKGRFIAQSPNGDGIFYEKIFYGDFTHETLFTIRSSEQLFLSIGFTKIKSYSVDFPIRNFGTLLRKLIWKWMVIHQKFRKWIATGDGSGIFTPNLLIVAEK
jgi:SAM-dependent methyltransferase